MSNDLVVTVPVRREPWGSLVLRSIGTRHPEQHDECERLADQLTAALTGPMTSDKLRSLNAAWARMGYWIDRFKGDSEPLTMP